MSDFWKYFSETLRWPQAHTPGPVQALLRGLAGSMDATRDDALYLREQFFPAKAEAIVLPGHGDSRGVTRHPKETDTQFRARVVHAWRWHMLGGKTLGLPEILKFYGFNIVGIENMRQFLPSRWAEFQIGFQSPATQSDQQAMLDNLQGLIWLVNEYKPARSFFFRMYNDVFDKRPIVLSVGPKLGDGWLSLFSGVPVEDTGNQGKDTIVSFGTRYGWQSSPYLAAAACASFGSTVHLGFLAPYIDRFMVGRSRLSDVYPRNHGFAMDSFFSILWADRATAARRWRGEWDARRWLDYTGFDRKLPRWRMARRQTSRAQLVPGWGETLSDHNARLGATFATVINNPPRLGSFRLSDHDPQRRELRLHEMFLHTNAATVPPVKPGIPQTSGAALLASSAPVPDLHRAQQARHDELAAHMQPREALPPQAAASLHLAAQSISVSPCAAPPFAVTSYHAPQWQGAWTEPGRTWRTSKFISRY